MSQAVGIESGRRRCAAQRVALCVSLCALLSGCGTSVSQAGPTPSPQPATPFPTVQVRYVVEVTPFAIATPRPRVFIRRATPFVPPPGPYLVLSPRTGPPTTRTIRVRGGNLPPSSEIALVWSAGGHSSSLSSTTYTNRKGSLSAYFEVPGSPPGQYRIVAEANGVPYTTAAYSVTSSAVLTVSSHPIARGERIAVSGSRFLPNVQFLLVVYPTFRGVKPIVLGRSRAGKHGKFLLVRDIGNLIPGQYILHAWPASTVAAQTAETAFEVVI